MRQGEAAQARAEAQARGKLGTNASVLLVEHRRNKALGRLSGDVGVQPSGTRRLSRRPTYTPRAGVAEEDVWKLTDAIAQSDTGKALATLQNLFVMNKSEFEVLGTITWLIKNAYFAATSDGARLKAYPVQKARPLADKLGKEKIRDAFALCMNTEVMLRSTGVDRTLALELLVIKLAAPRRQARASKAV